MTVKTIEHVGVWVSTSPPPRSSTLYPAPRLRNASAEANMFCVDQPNQSAPCRRIETSHGL